jgi:hypothetical protein
VVELHDHCGLVVFYQENGKISVFVYLPVLLVIEIEERTCVYPAV